jgi:hypothetical protein
MQSILQTELVREINMFERNSLSQKSIPIITVGRIDVENQPIDQ